MTSPGGHEVSGREPARDAHAPDAGALRVYIAASTGELQRARAAVDALLAIPGIEVVSTWLDVVERIGVANPTDAPRADRVGWANNCLTELGSADVLWFLVPPAFAPTRGAWIELGYAHAIGARLVSSGTTKQSIFCALTNEFDTDDEARSLIAAMAQERAA